MTNKRAKKSALNTLFQNKLYSLDDYSDLQRIIESNKFVIIEYKKHSNSKHVAELIKRLKIENEIELSDSFIYIKSNLRFVFIHAGVSDEDKCALLRHELGHIVDPDFKNSEETYSKIKKEEFANEFSFYVKNPGFEYKLKLLIAKNIKRLIGAAALTACITGLIIFNHSTDTKPENTAANTMPAYAESDSEYYVTKSGEKYHRKHCTIVKYKNNLTKMTLNQATQAGYEPCMMCIPQE